MLAHRDFATYTEAEHEQARRALGRLRVVGAARRSRRLARTRRTARRPDVRRTVRAALRTDGEPIRRHARQPSLRPRRLVVLCDVSGSMEPYTRVIIRFLHAAVVARTRVEAFALGTRVTRVTRELSTRDPDAAVAAAAARVVDWSGGTRLGETLRTFNAEWGVRGLARGGVVVIVSDGWDRGAPELLGAEMARLAACRPPDRLGQPAEGEPRVRPARGGDGGGPAPCGRVRRGPLARVARGAGRGDRAHDGGPAGPGPDGDGVVKEVLDEIEAWRAAGRQVAVARVVGIEGSGPRDPGATMAVNDAGEVAGSVSGGCVEGAVVRAALDVLAGRTSRGVVSFGYSDDEAFAVGLTCGGTVHVYVEPLDW